jgi:hypothetical protein
MNAIKNPNQRARPRLRGLAFLFGVWLAIFLAGCKTIDSNSASQFATGVLTVRSQADTALTAAATLTRNAGVTYVAAQPTLTESDFVETPTGDVIAAWDDALFALENYALNLAALSSPDTVKGFDAAATNVVAQFTQISSELGQNSLQTSPEVSAGLAAAFAEVGRLMLKAGAQADARRIAMATDPQIANILNLLAAEVGSDHTGAGLRTTVYRSWDVNKDALTGDFLRAKDPAAKTAVAQKYANLLAEREAEDTALLGLQRSLLALRDAHHALAEGDPALVASSLAIISHEQLRLQNAGSQSSNAPKK